MRSHEFSIAWTGKPGQNSQNRTGQPGEDSQEKTARIANMKAKLKQAEQEKQNRTVRTKQ
jgi:hypothetical protein